MVSDSSIHHIYQSGIIFDLAVRPRAHGKHNLSKLPLINSTLNTKTLTTKVILKHQSLLNRDFRSQGLEALVGLMHHPLSSHFLWDLGALF